MATHHLTTDLLEPTEDPTQWRPRLDAVGLLAPVSTPDDEAPQAAIVAIQRDMSLLDEARQRAAEVTTIELPDVVWWLVGGALLSIILFAEALVATLGPVAILGGLVLAIGTALFTFYDRNRRKAEAHVRYIVGRLRADIEVLLTRSFVIRLGGNVLVSTPDLDDLVLMADATALTDPGAEITRRITNQIAELQDRVESLIAQPGAWRRQELSVDLDTIQREIDALPPPVPPAQDD
ncbi:MAG: hypothetical protein ACI8RZ_003812 [Myxococcota bacterium]|jgi:hypothetical protein